MTQVTIQLPSPLRRKLGGQREVTVEAGTVGAAIQRLAEQFPSLRTTLLLPDGHLRSSVALYLNEEDVRSLAGVDTPVHDDDRLSIVPAIAGGQDGMGTQKEAPISRDDLVRYSRHLLLPEVGVEGQKKLRRSKVLIVGAGGLGAPTALYLAAAGVGEIGLVDFDQVELSNLQRQVLYTTADVGRPKVEAARDRLQSLNPGVRVTVHSERLSAANALETLRPYDVILDGTDNFPTRYLVNDACVLLGKPAVYGSIYRFEGQASVFDARRGPCYRCLYPEPPPPELVPSCAEAGVFGVLPGLVGVIQATETIKLLLDLGEPLVGRLLLFDALAMGFRELHLRKNPDCVLCSEKATQTGLIDYAAFCGVAPPGADPTPSTVPEVSPKVLAEELAGPEPPMLVDVRDPEEWAIVHLPGATLIPRAQLADRVGELTLAREVVVYCRSGVRSAQATRLLLDLGFQHVRALKGGILAWARDVDPGLPTY